MKYLNISSQQMNIIKNYQFFNQIITLLRVVLLKKCQLSHSPKDIRAVFSGHSHVFAAFKRKDLFYFVNGVGGGALDKVHSEKKMGERVWITEELHGGLVEVNDQSYGYQHHLDSYSKYTRTEVQFEGNTIVYTIRDLDTNEVVQTYEQTF
ncbi:Alkaline_phosphatase [Hexamita inflata]|uniref:Alkaline phosphatase n=1 Tax=Hexamita inflata TaxID=28002 RepID=A0AA86P545_9EUKA|nr:Alkaline phosphatase [Hexamita inflata]